MKKIFAIIPLLFLLIVARSQPTGQRISAMPPYVNQHPTTLDSLLSQAIPGIGGTNMKYKIYIPSGSTLIGIPPPSNSIDYYFNGYGKFVPLKLDSFLFNGVITVGGDTISTQAYARAFGAGAGSSNTVNGYFISTNPVLNAADIGLGNLPNSTSLSLYNNDAGFITANSPSLFGIPLTVSPPDGDSSTKIPNTGWMKRNVSGGAGGGFTPSGTSSQYITGSGTYVIFPNNLSFFTNDVPFLITADLYTDTAHFQGTWNTINSPGRLQFIKNGGSGTIAGTYAAPASQTLDSFGRTTAITAGVALPSVSGQSGKFLSNNGTIAQWVIGGGGGGSPAPDNGTLQFYYGGAFVSSNSLYFDSTSKYLVSSTGLAGGTGAGNNLTLSSTTNATKGKIYFGSAQISFYDGTNGDFTFSSTTVPQVSLLNGAGSFTVGVASSGQATLTSSNNSITFASGSLSSISNLTITGLFATNGTNTNSAFHIASAIGAGNTTVANYLPTAATTVYYRTGFRGSTAAAPASGADYSGVVFAQASVTSFTSGTHNLLTGVSFIAPNITAGGATISHSANVFIKDPPNLGTIKDALWIGSGMLRADGGVTALLYTQTAPGAVTASSSTTVDLATGNVITVNMNASITTLTINNITVGEWTWKLVEDGTGSRTISWPVSVKWSGGTAPTLSGANKTDIIVFRSDGTNLYGSFTLNY